ncbi:MAG TPA: HD domain-containing protein [Acidobacteria bacterium]|nr:HD domain-containing protein [Acidobacteriota bacterium]
MGLLHRFRSSLTYPIVATLVLVTVVPVVGVGLLLSTSNREHLMTLEKQFLTRQAVGLAREVSLFFQRHETELAATAQALGAGRPIKGDSFTALVQQMASADPALIELQAVDTSGNGGFARAKELSPATVNALEQLVAQSRAAALEGKTIVRHHVEVPGYPRAIAIFGYPLESKRWGRWGALVAVLDLEDLDQRLHDNALAGLFITILDGHGKPVLASNSELLASHPGNSPLVKDFLGRPLRLTRTYDRVIEARKSELLGSIAPVENPPWGVLVERPTRFAFATVRAMQHRTLVATAIAAAAAFGLGLLLSGYLIRPLQELTAVTSEVAEGNLEVRAQIASDNEIGHLAKNFNHMAGSIEALVRRLRQALRQNQELFLETIRTLAAAIDAKDPYTRGHSERVSSYSMAIAKHLGLDSEAVFRVRIGAILHDVGKLGIRDSILQKPAGLTAEEYAVMRRHPEIGSQIMAPIRMLKDIIPAIRNHHETWDGKGYPDHLAGEQIPLIARIVGVADSFDAMTTNRPYQKAMPLDHVVSQLRAMAGTRFDPRVVEAFVEAVQARDITPPTFNEAAAREIS